MDRAFVKVGNRKVVYSFGIRVRENRHPVRLRADIRDFSGWNLNKSTDNALIHIENNFTAILYLLPCRGNMERAG